MNGDLQFYAVKTEWSPWDEAAVLKMRYELRAELAKTITCVGLLVDLSMDQHAIVRKGAAQNSHTPITTLRRLAEQDLCSSVQDAAKTTLIALTS
ncbi:hypothetical protein [Planomicrobium sp. CPCC 101079]|uniref:hypothetical protein n=1 Tax=Planomicrobium sp. CPCC 101079 TaxID=2599618 RepID=UPI0011B7F7AF|nr:hypothetical protein [Planomicrobium sp. CPCC 101079]TWT04897.1 hypothetical protein FQV28_09865 [Planomicrobium sp. CPCC 101079]